MKKKSPFHLSKKFHSRSRVMSNVGHNSMRGLKGKEYRKTMMDLIFENDRLRKRIKELEKGEHMKEMMEKESDEETRRFIMEEISTPRFERTTIPPRKDVKTLFHSAFSVEKFKTRLKLKPEGNSSESEYMFPYELMHVFQRFDRLDFNVFKIKEQPLLNVSMFYLTIHGLLKIFKIPIMKMQEFIESICIRYKKSNPYHNHVHVADCLQTAHAIMSLSKKFDTISALDKLILFFAILGHDLDHPSFSNRYLVLTNHKYAMDHNDQSPLENHSCRLLFLILRQHGILEHLTIPEKRRLRKLIVDMILETDTSKFSRFEDIIKELLFPSTSKKKRKNSDSYSSDSSSSSSSESEEEEEEEDDNNNERKKEIITNPNPKGLLLLLMKCSDISNPIKSPKIYLKWTKRVISEFYNQGDEERKKKIEISAFMNRHETSIPKCQIGFLKYLVIPVYQILADYDPLSFNYIIEDLNIKNKFWESKLREEEEVNEKYELKRISKLTLSFSNFMNKNKIKKK